MCKGLFRITVQWHSLSLEKEEPSVKIGVHVWSMETTWLAAKKKIKKLKRCFCLLLKAERHRISAGFQGVAWPIFSTSMKKTHVDPGAHFGFVSGL